MVQPEGPGLSLDCPPASPSAISTILATWLEQYPQDFDHPPQYTSLHVLLDYAQLILRDSELGHRVQLLLGRLQHPEPTEAELEGEQDGDECM